MLAAILFGSQATLPVALRNHSLASVSNTAGFGTSLPNQRNTKKGACAAVLRLPELFKGGHMFPCLVEWLEIQSVLLQAGTGADGMGSSSAAVEGVANLKGAGD